jgi:hypothetical protein
MPRFVRNTAILAKIETTYNTDPTPTGSANALLVSNLSTNPLNANNVDRDLVRPYFGASEQLLGTYNVEMGFDIELTGSGVAGTAPLWGPLIRACSFAEVLTATTRVDYTPITSNQESVTIYWYDDGVLQVATGCRGTMTLAMKSGERPVMSFKFTGLVGAMSAVANPSITLTGWKTPQIPTDANTMDLTYGGAVSPTGAPAITGGTSYPSTGLDLDIGNTVTHTPLIGGETVDVTDRQASGKVQLDLTAAQEVSFLSTVKLATLGALSMLHGTVAGQKVLVHVASAQLFNPSKAELNGRRMIGYDLRAVPTPGGSGNDELRIVTSF